MTSLTGPPATDQTTPAVFAKAMSRADGCPGCLTNLCVPYKVEIENDGFTAWYRCDDCREMWFTGWGA